MASHTSITRRNLLKQITLGTAVAGNLSLYPSLGYSQNNVSTDNTKQNTAGIQGTDLQHDLLVTLVLSSAVPHGSAVISNQTDNPLVLHGFDPGNIVFDNHYVDLTQATGVDHSNPLTLKSGEARAFQVVAHSLFSTEHTSDHNTYVWADDAVELLSPDAKLISMGGLLDVKRAVLYAKPVQPDSTLRIS